MANKYYEEDHGIIEVKVIEDNSDDEKESYKLEVVKVICDSYMGDWPDVGTVFDVWQMRNFYYSGKFKLRDEL